MQGFLVFFVIIIVMVVRISKELSKVNQSRPSTDMPPVPSEGQRGARGISDFLEELKRQHQAATQPAQESFEEQSAYDEQMALRERVRKAVRENREMKTRVLDEPPPLVVSPVKPKPVVVQQVHDAYSVVNTAIQDEREAEQKRVGLEHPVFAGSLYDPMAITKRAIVLREVMGPPVGLR